MSAFESELYIDDKAKNFSSSEAWLLVPEYLADLKKVNAHGIGDNISDWDAKVLIARVRETRKVVGFLAYTDDWKGANAINISAAYVVPEYRRRGIHSAMFAKLVEKAKDGDFGFILSGVAVENTASIQSNLKRGSVMTYHRFQYTVQK